MAISYSPARQQSNFTMDETYLKTLNRANLQILAKEHGVRANMKSADIVEQLAMKLADAAPTNASTRSSQPRKSTTSKNKQTTSDISIGGGGKRTRLTNEKVEQGERSSIKDNLEDVGDALGGDAFTDGGPSQLSQSSAQPGTQSTGRLDEDSIPRGSQVNDHEDVHKSPDAEAPLILDSASRAPTRIPSMKPFVPTAVFTRPAERNTISLRKSAKQVGLEFPRPRVFFPPSPAQPQPKPVATAVAGRASGESLSADLLKVPGPSRQVRPELTADEEDDVVGEIMAITRLKNRLRYNMDVIEHLGEKLNKEIALATSCMEEMEERFEAFEKKLLYNPMPVPEGAGAKDVTLTDLGGDTGVYGQARAQDMTMSSDLQETSESFRIMSKGKRRAEEADHLEESPRKRRAGESP